MKRSSCPSQRGFIPLKFGNQGLKQMVPDASAPHEHGIRETERIFSTSDDMTGGIQVEADSTETALPHPGPEDGCGGLAAKRSPFSLIPKHQNTPSLNSSLKSKPAIKCAPEAINAGLLLQKSKL
jgi:hypothetical protein